MELPREDSVRTAVREAASENAVFSYTLDKLAADPTPNAGRGRNAALVIDPNDASGLELALHDALREAGLQQQRVAVFFVPIGAGPPASSAQQNSTPVQTTRSGLVIDERAHEVALDGQFVHLTAKEFALISYLFERRGAVFSRETLLRDLWGEGYAGGARTVDVHVRRVRSKLGSEWLDTVRGIGYRFGRHVRVQSLR